VVGKHAQEATSIEVLVDARPDGKVIARPVVGATERNKSDKVKLDAKAITQARKVSTTRAE